jgi:hypothetical protein
MNQIANLIFNPSFGHNLCFKCPNGSCEPILNIYVPKDFQSYNFFSIQWVLTLEIFLVEDSGIHRNANSQNGSSLGSVDVHSLTLSHSPRSMKCDSRPSHLACTFANPCLGHKPKTRVMTHNFFKSNNAY